MSSAQHYQKIERVRVKEKVVEPFVPAYQVRNFCSTRSRPRGASVSRLNEVGDRLFHRSHSTNCEHSFRQTGSPPPECSRLCSSTHSFRSQLASYPMFVCIGSTAMSPEICKAMRRGAILGTQLIVSQRLPTLGRRSLATSLLYHVDAQDAMRWRSISILRQQISKKFSSQASDAAVSTANPASDCRTWGL